MTRFMSRHRALGSLAAALVVGGFSSPASAQTPQLAYAAQTQYTYNTDLTLTQSFSASSAGSTAPSAAASTQALRLQGQFTLTPVSVDAVNQKTTLKLSIPGQFQMSQGDGSGAWTPLSVDASAFAGDYLVEQGFNGQILSVDFPPLSGAAASDPQVLLARNSIKGLAGLLDFRLVSAATPQAALCTDVLGQYNAAFTRTSPTQIQVSKTSYVALAPGFGLYEVDGDTAVPMSAASLSASGQSTITLGASNIIAGRHIANETVQLVPAAAAPDPGPSTLQPATDSSGAAMDGGSFTASNSAWASMNGDLTLVGTSAASGSVNTATYSDRESLQAQSVPVQSLQPTAATRAAATLHLSRGLAALGDPETRLSGQVELVRALRGGAALDELRRPLLDPGADPEISAAIAGALAGHRTPETRDLVREGLESRQLGPRVKDALLKAMLGAPKVESGVLDAVEGLAAGRTPNSPQALRTLASLVPAVEKGDAVRADRIVVDLCMRLDAAKDLRTKVDLLSSLAATRSERALPALQRYAAAQGTPMGLAAARGLAEAAAPGGSRALSRPGQAQLSAAAAMPDPDFGPFVTSTNYMTLLTANSVAPYTSSQKYGNNSNTLVTKSAGSKLIGGTAWAGYALGANFPDKRLAFAAAAGLQVNLLGMTIPVVDAEGVAFYDSKDSTKSGTYWTYHFLSLSANNGSFWDLPMQDTPDDPQNPYYTHDYPKQFWDYDSGPIPVGPFFADFQAGAGMDTGKDTKQSVSDSQDMYAVIAPWTSVSAYAEASIGWFCLDLALELDGQFLKTSIPMRVDADMSSVVHPANTGNNLPAGTSGFSWATTEGLQVTPWSIQLIGRFDYCIGSESTVLWSDSARPEKWILGSFADPAADLAVSGLSWTPNDGPDTSKPITFSVTVTNLSKTRTNPDVPVVTTVKTADGLNIGSFTVVDVHGNPRPLAAGEVYTGTVKWAAPVAGQRTVIAKVNDVSAASRITETDYTNNTLSQPITVLPALPDLVVGSVKVTSPGTASAGAKVQVLIANVGPGAVPQVQSGLFLVPRPVAFKVMANGSVLYQGSTPVGTAVPVTLPATAGGAQVGSISVTVNSDNAITEKTTSNDTMSNIDVTRADSGAPVVGLAYAKVLDWGNELHQWSAAVSEDGRVDRLDWYLDGALADSSRSIPTAGSFSFNYTLNVKALAAGSHTLQLKATDQAGNTGSSPAATFTVLHPDVTAPTVTVNPVVDLNSVYTLSATAADNRDGVDHVDFYLDKLYVGTSSASPYRVTVPYAVPYTSPTSGVIQPVTHACYAVAYDKANAEPGYPTSVRVRGQVVGNSTQSSPVLFEKNSVFHEVEPNNDLAHANGVYAYCTQLSGNATRTDTDWFKVPCPAGKTLTLSGKLHMVICDATGAVMADNLAVNASDDDGDPAAHVISWTNTSASGYVYVSIAGYTVVDRIPEPDGSTKTVSYGASGDYVTTLQLR